MSHPLRLERPQLLTDLAFERIRKAIVEGDLRLGEQVSEIQLAQSMGISKTPVREALVRLKIQGLVEIHPQRGTFVFQLEPVQVTQLCRFRSMIEIAALREAYATNRNVLIDELAALVKAMELAEAAGDVNQLSWLDMDFHHVFLTCCPNTYLRGAYDLIRYQLIALRFRAPIDNGVESHQVLVDVLQRGKVDKACAMLHDHIHENEARYCAACLVA
ncbi:GntR family transcriptional regulator [Aquincola tertiaricarbonis]|uniref:GntR family transcriptional regulator n=1 Tax=Aquincola tertiaricarbonis TaxID=391953 RepID=UPI000614A183|nr:GntR family transcriptional regulator [Aquincola tertiaricarbonis]